MSTFRSQSGHSRSVRTHTRPTSPFKFPFASPARRRSLRPGWLKKHRWWGIVGFASLALVISLFWIKWKPAHAAVPGAAGDGVVNPAFGSYGDSITIDVPDYYDLEPQLKLVYSSGNGNDIAGMGWGISADSFIERISPGGGAPAYNNSDTFHLDGGELLSNTSLGGTHCTKNQSYRRITQDVANDRWYVWDKDGNKSTYTSLYRVLVGTDNHLATFRWALSTVQDTNGNTVNYSYWVEDAQNCYLDTISYNGYSIKFWREGRPDPASFANGDSVGHTRFRYKTIEVKAGASRVRAYKLGYGVSANTGRSLLKSVQEFGSDAILDATGTVTGGTSLPARTMSYSAGGVGYPRTHDINQDTGGWSVDFYEYDADINGDGKDDHVRIWNNDGEAWAQVNLSNGKGFPVVNARHAVGSWSKEHKDNFVDVNGDGKADFVRIWNSGGKAKAQVNLSNGTSFPTQASNLEFGVWNTAYLDYFADINGDGKTDLIRVWNHQDGNAWAQVSLSDGTGYPVKNYNASIGAWNTDYKNFFVDVNGDGKADLVRIWNKGGRAFAQVNFSNGTGFPIQNSNVDVGGWGATVKDYFIDLNADGKADLVRLWNSAGKAKAQISLSTGLGFPTISNNAEIGDWDDTTQDHFADVNGDGRPDLIRMWNNAGKAFLQVHLFDGFGYGKVSTDQSVGSFNANWKDSFADVDGDGRADFVRLWNNNGRAFAQVNLASEVGGTTPPDLLTSVTNGVGGSTAITYVPSSEWPSKFSPRGGNFPTVATITVNDGRGKSGVTTYSYADAKYSSVDKLFLGFRFQEAVIDDLGTFIETFNRQTPQSVGEADAIYTKNNAGQIYGYTTYTYSEAGNGVTIPFTSHVAATSEFEVNLGVGGRENRSTFEYDAYGNQTKLVYEGDVGVSGDEYIKTVSYYYNPELYLMDLEMAEQKYAGTVVNPANKIDESIYYYDGALSTSLLPTKGNLTRSDNWNNQTGGYVSASGTFDSYGNQTSATDPRGSISSTIFDSLYHQYPIQSTNALGHTTTAVWDYVKGVALSTTDENGATKLFGYDPLGRQTSLTDEFGYVTTTEYINFGDPNSQRVRKTLPDGSATGLWTDTYSDGLGRVYKTVRKGPSEGVTYIKEAIFNDADESPQQVSIWYQSGSTPKWENFLYDGVGRMIRTTHADGSFATLTYALDSAGKPCTTTTDELGHQRTVWIDTMEQVIRVMEKNGDLFYNTYRTYDTEGQLVQIKDNDNQVTSYTYNSLGQTLSCTEVNTGTVTKTYDTGGLMLSETDAKGQTITFTYDALGRTKTKTAGGETTTWYYDEAGFGASVGELTRIVYPAGSESFFYDRTGQVTSATKTIGSVSKTLSNTYDSMGRLKSLTYPDGEVVVYGYNADGALYSVSGYVDAMIYGPNGELIQLTYANGTTSTFEYDPNRLWLTTASVKKGPTVLYTGAYTYNAAQLVTSMTHGTPLPQTTIYNYDDLGRLLSANGAQTQWFSYDSTGNMLSNSLKGAYSYADPRHRHAVTSAGSSIYTYDANGNMETGNGKLFSWDAQDRLTSVVQGERSTRFVYGAEHDRLQKIQGENSTLYFNSLFEQTNGDPTQYYYAGSIMVAKKDAAGTKTWYHADRIGSIRLMTNDAGAEVNDNDYLPFGAILSTSGTVSNERGFSGQINDAETGLMYYNARYYDAGLGRFISADTATQGEDDPQDLNAYSYCGNNPVNYSDPTGHYRVFSGMMRYVTWSRVTVSRSITVRVPYIILYPTFQFYWRNISVSKTITWWFFGWHHRTATVSISVPAMRVIWHLRTGFHTFHRTIRFSVMVPHVHFRAMFRDVVVKAKRIYHKARHVYHVVKRAVHRAARHVARAAKAVRHAAKIVGHAAKGAGKWVWKHKAKIAENIAWTVAIAAAGTFAGPVGVAAVVGVHAVVNRTVHHQSWGEIAVGVASDSLGGYSAVVKPNVLKSVVDLSKTSTPWTAVASLGTGGQLVVSARSMVKGGFSYVAGMKEGTYSTVVEGMGGMYMGVVRAGYYGHQYLQNH